jgi:AIPR protein
VIREVLSMSQDDRLVLGEIFKQQHQKDYPLLSPNEYFEIFASEQILKARGYDLDPDQIASGIVGGGNDGGVDSFYLFVNSKLVREDTDPTSFKGQQLDFDLVIIQSKNKPSFEEVPLTKLQDFTENCLRMSSDLAAVSRTLYRQRLLDAVALFHQLYHQSLLMRSTLKIGYYYASFGEQINEKVQIRGQLLCDKAQTYFTTAKCEIEFAGASRLLTWFYKTPSTTATLETTKTFHWGGFGKAYVCLVTLEKFASFITDKDAIRSYMFEANVRDYQGDVTVNEQIAETLLSPSGTEEFWWLNNGVTVLASEVRLDGDNMSITSPLIVNGLQTSHTIFNHNQLVGFKNDNRTILVRVIETSNPTSIDHIIKATNSQTTIPRIWLHATEEIHRKIESVLRAADLYYDRRKNFHRNQGVSSSKIITIPYLSQALAAIVLQKPDDARARPTTVADRHYEKLFSDDYPMELYSKCALILRRTEEFLDAQNLERGEKLNLMFYLAMFATCVSLKSPAPKRPTIAAINIGKLDDAMMLECLQFIAAAYEKLGADDRAAKGPQLVSFLKETLQQNFGRKRSRAVEM